MHPWLNHHPLYLITQSPFSKKQIAHLEAAIRGGVGLVQLRDKTSSDSELMEKARYLQSKLASHGVPLVVNDRLAVAQAVNAGLHIGRDDGCPREARRVLGKDAFIGLTAHRWVEDANQYADCVDYIGCGPVFETTTKKDALPAFGLSVLKDLCFQSKIPVVAIGGVHQENVGAVWKSGVASIAICSAVWSAENTEVAARNLCYSG